jgi:hypothetical protein
VKASALFAAAFMLGALCSDVGEPLMDWPGPVLWFCPEAGAVHFIRSTLKSSEAYKSRVHT